jgi:hypothetical protein
MDFLNVTGTEDSDTISELYEKAAEDELFRIQLEDILLED